MCWDQKRRLINVRNVDGLITADTEPHETIDDYYAERNAQDEWRKSQRRTLKTAEDHADFLSWKTSQAARQKAGVKADNSLPLLAVAITKAAASGTHGFAHLPQATIAEGVSQLCGRRVPVMKVKDVKRRGGNIEDLIGSVEQLTEPEVAMMGRIYHAHPAVFCFVDRLLRPQSPAASQMNTEIMIEVAREDYERDFWEEICSQEADGDGGEVSETVSHRSGNCVLETQHESNRHFGLNSDGCEVEAETPSRRGGGCALYGIGENRHLPPDQPPQMSTSETHSAPPPLHTPASPAPQNEPDEVSSRLTGLVPHVRQVLRRAHGVTGKHLRLGAAAAGKDGTPAADRPMAALAHALAIRDGLPVELAVLIIQSIVAQHLMPPDSMVSQAQGTGVQS
jgi:hypothetical protein